MAHAGPTIVAVSAAHQALRAATSAAHERLDALFARFDLTDRAGYVAFLQAHAAAQLPVEAALDAAGAERIAPDWGERHRAALLRQDLATLDAAVPPALPAPTLDSDAAVAGALYVVEGSRLGGRFLARQVPAGWPHLYLDQGVGAPSWPFLLSKLDAALYDAATISAATDAALAVFALFERAGRERLVG